MISEFLRDALQARSGGFIYVHGPPGVGKTTVVKEVFAFGSTFFFHFSITFLFGRVEMMPCIFVIARLCAARLRAGCGAFGSTRRT